MEVKQEVKMEVKHFVQDNTFQARKTIVHEQSELTSHLTSMSEAH